MDYFLDLNHKRKELATFLFYARAAVGDCKGTVFAQKHHFHFPTTTRDTQAVFYYI
jgi:hypothetical protein